MKTKSVTCEDINKKPFKVRAEELTFRPSIYGILIEKKADWITKLTELIEAKEPGKYPEKLDQISELAYHQAQNRFTYQKIVRWIENIFD